MSNLKEVIKSPDYIKDLKKIKDKSIKEALYKKLQKIVNNPPRKKFLKNVLRNKQRERIKNFRLIFEWSEDNTILYLLRFRKRGDVYK